MLFLSSADFFYQYQLFRKIISGIPSECQTDWIQIKPEVLSGLIWVHSVWKGFQYMTLVGNELTSCQKFNPLSAKKKNASENVVG